MQFNYSLLTRIQRISHENLRLRDPAWLAGAEAWFEQTATGLAPRRSPPADVRAVPRARRGAREPRRGVADGSSTARWTARRATGTSCIYAERAKGGAGLVITEMTCVTPEGRISPGCTGLYAPEHERAWTRIVDFVHAETPAKIGMQLGHSGPKGSTQLGWEESDDAADVRQLGGDRGRRPSRGRRQPGAAGDDARRHGRGARRVRRVGTDGRSGWLRLARAPLRARLPALRVHHAAHQPRDATSTAAALENRMRFPLEVFRAMRAAWPDGKPMSVRISAHDWVGERGITPEDAVAVSRLLRRGRRRSDRRVGGPDLDDAQAGLRPHVPDAVLGPDPQRGRHGDDGGRQHLRARPRQLDPHGRPRRSLCLARPHLADPVLDAARRRPSSATTGRPGRSRTSPGRDQLRRLAVARPRPCWARCDGRRSTGHHALVTGRRQRHRRGDRRGARRRRAPPSRSPAALAPLEEVCGDAAAGAARSSPTSRANPIAPRCSALAAAAFGPVDIVVANAGAAGERAGGPHRPRRSGGACSTSTSPARSSLSALRFPT